MPNNALAKISELGQSIWYDNIERGMLEEGELTRMVEEDHVVGVTSNPAIFQKLSPAALPTMLKLRKS